MSDEKLDGFLPDEETLYSIRRKLVDAGVEDVNMEWLRAVSAAFVKHISTSKEGYNYISRLLNFHWQQGANTKEYLVLDRNGEVCREADAEQVHIFSGCLVNGVAVRPSNIRIREKPGYRCDDCGTRAHCVTETLNYRRDDLESLCNTCLKHAEEQRQQNLHSSGMCHECDDLNCPHNPKLEEHKLENEPCQPHHLAFGRIR